MLELQFNPKKGIWCEEPESLEKLSKNCFGTEKKGKIWLQPEEALYLINFQNAECFFKGKPLAFNELASHFKNEPRLFIRYNAYRDWRDRGLVLKRPEEVKYKPKKAKKRWKRYPSKPLEPEKLSVTASWYPTSMFSVIEDEATGRFLFENGWYGQFGIYKQDRGNLLKLNFLETVLLGKHFSIKIQDVFSGKSKTWKEVLEDVVKEREYSEQLFEVYEDWRLRGFIVKTGFKFGSHFRIYFPGASPVADEKWIHSKHVLHVFPKEQKLLISEWARVVRVAHSVKKTFLLSIPEMTDKDYKEQNWDFLAWRRKKVKGNWIRETLEDKPRYLLVSVSEDEHIGGVELASLLKQAEEKNLELILSICDRETSVTYYVLNKITLPGSSYTYYEIEWMKP